MGVWGLLRVWASQVRMRSDECLVIEIWWVWEVRYARWRRRKAPQSVSFCCRLTRGLRLDQYLVLIEMERMVWLMCCHHVAMFSKISVRREPSES